MYWKDFLTKRGLFDTLRMGEIIESRGETTLAALIPDLREQGRDAEWKENYLLSVVGILESLKVVELSDNKVLWIS